MINSLYLEVEDQKKLQKKLFATSNVFGESNKDYSDNSLSYFSSCAHGCSGTCSGSCSGGCSGSCSGDCSGGCSGECRCSTLR